MDTTPRPSAYSERRKAWYGLIATARVNDPSEWERLERDMLDGGWEGIVGFAYRLMEGDA